MFSAFSGYARIDLTNANIVVDGNSLSLSSLWPSDLAALSPFSTNGSTVTSVAVGAQTTTNMLSDATTQVDTLIASGKPNIVIAWEIINDLYFGASVATAKANIETYCSGRQAAGFKVVVVNALPTQRANLADDLATTQAKLEEMNAWMAASYRGFADALLDTRAIPGLETWSSTYFYDNVHINSAGDDLIAGALTGLLQKLRR